MRWLMRAITRTFLVGLFRLEGKERVPRSGALIICSNHSSTVDPPMVPAFVPRSDTWSMAKAEWFHDFRRVIFRAYHAFPVVRHTADRRAIRRANEILEKGQALVMYPEGTRVREGGLRRGEPGAGFLALKRHVPVQPAALVGTRDCFPTGARWPRRVPVVVRFGTPFVVAAHYPDGRRVSNQDAADAIMVRIADLMPEAARGDYTDLESWRTRLAGVWA